MKRRKSKYRNSAQMPKKQSENGIAGDSDQKHTAATVFIRQSPEDRRADQHAKEEQRAGLQCLWTVRPKVFAMAAPVKPTASTCRVSAAQTRPNTPRRPRSKRTCTRLIERLFDGNFHAVMCPLLPAEDMPLFTAPTMGCCQSPLSDIARSFACKYSQKLSAWAGSAAS